MSEHPQISAYRQAAAAMKAERYWGHENNPDEQADFLAALGDVLTEVCYQLDKYQVLDPDGLEAYRAAARLTFTSIIPTSSELILTSALEQRRSQLSAGASPEEVQVDDWVLDAARRAVADYDNEDTLVFPPRGGKTVESHVADQWPTALGIARRERNDHDDQRGSR